MASEASAFCPGHVTAFFEPVAHADPFRKGSRGAGLCLSLGVKTKVKARQGRRQKVRIFLNRREEPAETTRDAIERAIGGAAYEVVVQSEVQLPQSQGFGMSAAGALSATMAVNEALDLGLSPNRVVAIAHAAEVTAKTGLGDVLPASMGGMDLRLEPGAPPSGVVRRIAADNELLLAVLGPPLPTKTVLGNPARTGPIATAGRACVEEFSNAASLENLFALGRRFAVESGLAESKVREAMEAAAPYGNASMAMIGNSVFAVGQMDPLDALFKGMGAQRYRCRVESKGARLV